LIDRTPGCDAGPGGAGSGGRRPPPSVRTL